MGKKTLWENASYQHFLHFPQCFQLFPTRLILDFPESKEFADDNFKVDENGRKFSKMGRKHWVKEKLLITSNFSFSHSVFKTLVLQTRKTRACLGKGSKDFFYRVATCGHFLGKGKTLLLLFFFFFRKRILQVIPNMNKRISYPRLLQYLAGDVLELPSNTVLMTLKTVIFKA